jgi:cytochrome c-type biogenesis protein CcmH/NrfG
MRSIMAVTPRSFDARGALGGGIVALAAACALVRAVLEPGLAHGEATNRALAQGLSGDAAGAAAQLERIAEAHPNDGATWLRLGRALRQSSRLEESREALARAAQLLPGEAIVHYEMAKTYVESEAIQEAEGALARVLELKPRHAAAWCLRAGLAASRGDVDHAIEWLVLARSYRLPDLERFLAMRLFDPVRHDPRFAEAVRRQRMPGLAQEAAP